MSKQMEENNMKNFSNYTDFDTKENLHFESKAVHGALGTEPLTGAVSMPIFQAADIPPSGAWRVDRLCIQPSRESDQTGIRAHDGNS